MKFNTNGLLAVIFVLIIIVLSGQNTSVPVTSAATSGCNPSVDLFGCDVSGSGSTGLKVTTSAANGIGVYGNSSNQNAAGVYGRGIGSASKGVIGESTVVNGYGVMGVNSSGGLGIYSQGGILGITNTCCIPSIRGTSTAGGPAGTFDGYVQISGNLSVSGSISKGGGSFKIDHPLDPANKYLYHSFVESPDMMNIYNGNATTDSKGYAVVKLPDYFEALNRDFRYQLTVMNEFSQAIISSEVKDNQFTIRTDKPNIKVSWQVTGIRQDAWANNHRIEVEQEKSSSERGKYLYPTEAGQPVDKGINYIDQQRLNEFVQNNVVGVSNTSTSPTYPKP